MSVETLVLMEQLADNQAEDAAVRDYALFRVIGRISNNDVAGQAERLANFVRDHVTYVRDPVGHEFITSPKVMLEQIDQHGYTFGDCDDHVMLLSALLGSVGIPAIPVGVKLGASRGFNHVIVSADINGEWIDIDPCAKLKGQPVYTERLIAT